MAGRVKRLLAISWAMPPMLFPRSVQVARLSGELARLGWQISVVCCQPDQAGPEVTLDHSLYAQAIPGLELVRAAPEDSPPAGQDPLNLRWQKSALAVARGLLKKNKYDALVSFAQPWVDHLIGLELKKASGLPWVAHFSDPWVDSPFYAGMPAKEIKAWAKLEKQVMRRADLILFTNEQARDLVMAKYPRRWQKKAASLPHAYDLDLLPPKASPELSGGSLLRLIYTGDFYGQRSPLPLFEALALLATDRDLTAELQVKLVGHTAPEQRKMADDMGLGQVVRFESRVAYTQSLQKLSKADVLLIIDAPSQVPGPFLPSKLVDYLMFNKPILGLSPADGASAQVLEGLGCPVIAPDDPVAIARALDDMLKRHRDGGLGVPKDFTGLAGDYDKRQVAARFQELLAPIL